MKTFHDAICEMICLPENASVIDLGCRNAGFLNRLAESFPGKIGTAIGVDSTDKNFGEAPCRAPVQLKVINCAEALPFPDGAFDLVFSKDMLECIGDKAALVREIHRILKPGGSAVCVNCDFDSIVYNGEDKEAISRAVHAYAVTKQGWMDDLDSWMGRRTYGVFHRSGLFESSISVHSITETEYAEGTLGHAFSHHIGWLVEEHTGALSAGEYRRFLDTLRQADRQRQYLFSKPYYIYRGVKLR